MSTPPPSVVPDSYRGVWSRTLLETPHQRDDQTWVRWMQTAHWHADLRVPAETRGTSNNLAAHKGFFGTTVVETLKGGEVCTWQRQLDFQPPGLHPDIGHMAFDGPDRVIETGIHDTYLEVWERLPGSTGRFAVLECAGTWLLVSGRYAMRVRPRTQAWPVGTPLGQTLEEVLQRQPQHAALWLDFEITFGTLENAQLNIEHSTLPALEGRSETCSVQRVSEGLADMRGPAGHTTWRVVEWGVAGPLLA